MVALLLDRAGLDPTAVIGGRLSAFGSNARLGKGEYMVAEADESDRSFLMLSPTIAVITNIDREHMESYGSWNNLQDAFAEFANKVPFYGAVIACADDKPVRELLPRLTRRVITYALDDDADVTGRGMELEAFGSRCTVTHRRPGAGVEDLGVLQLRVPGRHNVLNALAAIAVGIELGIPFPRIVSGLEEFRGAERRFQTLGEAGGVLVVDDYGHHPTEIAAVLAAARAGIGRRIVAVFQPHRYSRTEQLLDDFGPAFNGADRIVLTDIYSAGEAAIEGVTVETLAAAMRRVVPVDLVKKLEDLPVAVAGLAQPGDLVITLGAGSIGGVGERILEAIRQKGRPA
jgi:UDP-N-acetylmuramate--alanine ligase